MKNYQLDVFRCSCTERGCQCVSEFTRVNAFVPMMKTLERKNPGGVTIEVIVANAICPFHARILGYVRTDVVRMDVVVAEYFERVNKARKEEQEHQSEFMDWQRRRNRWLIATTPVFGDKLRTALR